MSRAAGLMGAVWGIAGVVAVLVYAVLKLSRHTLDAIAPGLTGFEWALLIASVGFMAYAEGYRGFQLRFAPRVAARALHLWQNPTVTRVLLAPFFCVGYFGATPRLQRLSWTGTGMVVVLVLIVQRLGQPWRGILDAGVVVGLSWGTIAVVAFTLRALQTRRLGVSPEVPALAGS